MISDMTHLQMFADLQAEIEKIIRDHNADANGLTDKKELIELRLRQYETLIEVCSEHHRVLRWHRGDAVEPRVHFGEATLVAQGGFGG